MSKIFLSGPISNQPNHNREAFLDAELRLMQQNHTVLSPANIIPLYQPEQITQEQYLSICFAMIDACDKVYFLKGWEHSKGSRAELDYAIQHQKECEWEVCNARD